jgi:hypothetical protein
MKLCEEGHQDLGIAGEAAISLPTGRQASAKSQTISKFQFPTANGFVSKFGHLVIGDYLEFGVWILGYQCLLGSRYAGLCLLHKLS